MIVADNLDGVGRHQRVATGMHGRSANRRPTFADHANSPAHGRLIHEWLVALHVYDYVGT